MSLILKIVLIGFYGLNVDGARILGFFPVAGKSLNILNNRLFKGLADAGHDVTIISAYKNKLPIVNGSYTDVVLTGFAEEYERLLDSLDLLDTQESYPIWESKYIHDLFIDIFKKAFHHLNVAKFLTENHKFDLFITEHLCSDSLLAFGAIFDCPTVLFITMGGPNPWVNEMVGNPLPISYVPHYWYLGDFSKGMTFVQRVHNLLYYLYDPIHQYFTSFPDHNALLKSVFANPPRVEDLYYNVSLVLLGTHSSLRRATPLVPNIVEIGGFHIDSPKKLPEDLQNFLDNAKEGVVYFSMGSNLKSKNFSPEKKSVIINVFKRLKLKILWKFEDEVLEGKPDNVEIRKWLPQTDILGHPNVKLFITHGGQGSLSESVYHGVPTLMIPVFADQYINAIQAASQGYGLKLSYNDPNFNEEVLYGKIMELLENPKYAKQAKRTSSLFHDRPMKPLDNAIYWIEYVIRHKGAPHLRVAGVELPWYQLYMVDVSLFIVLGLGVLGYVFLKIINTFFHRVAKWRYFQISSGIKKHLDVLFGLVLLLYVTHLLAL